MLAHEWAHLAGYAPEADANLWENCVPTASFGSRLRMADPVNRIVMAFQNASWLQAIVVMSRLTIAAPATAVVARGRALGIREKWVEACALPGSSPIPGVPRALLDAGPRHRLQPLPDSSAPLLQLAAGHWRRYRNCPPALRPAGFGTYLGGYYRYFWQAPDLAQLFVIGCRRVAIRSMRRRGKYRAR